MSTFEKIKQKLCIYRTITLSVYCVSVTVEFLVVAVAARIETADVDTRAIAERRRPMWITRALSQIMSGAAVLWYVVVAAVVQEVTARNCVACGRIVHRRVVIIALVVDEILADSWRVVTTEDRAMTQRLCQSLSNFRQRLKPTSLLATSLSGRRQRLCISGLYRAIQNVLLLLLIILFLDYGAL